MSEGIDRLLKSIAGMTKAERDAMIAEGKARKAARLAAMTPEERARYDEMKRLDEEHDQWLGQTSTLTNGEIERDREMLEQLIDEVQGDRDAANADAKQATNSQGGTDRALTKAHRLIKALEAQVAKLTEERDAARKAHLDLLDQQAKREA